MLKEMTLEEVQQVSLHVLEELDRFCRNNDIEYSLAYGTLIGAVRHKGFIPWDDDVDVVMSRPDYEKLISLYKDNDEFHLRSPKVGVCSLSYARLYDVKQTYVKSKSPWLNENCGVWIDIFPVDAVSPDRKVFLESLVKCRKAFHRVLKSRKAPVLWGSSNPIKKIRGGALLLAGFRHPTEKAVALDSMYNSIPYGSTGILSDLAGTTEAARCFPNSYFEDYVDIEFCGKNLRTIKDYDSYLRMIYGDYMQLPPEEKRVRGHSIHSYWWKDQQ